MTKRDSRYWGKLPVPESKAEFFNAVTTPAPTGDGSIATIRLYGPIDSWGGFWGVSAKDMGTVLDALPDSVDQIILRINSPGGEVFEGVSILNMLRAHKATVTAVVDGLAASAASVIASGADETVMSPGTQMMIHSPSVIAWGNATYLRKQAEVLDTIERSLIDIYTAKAGEKDWAQLLADETWLTAKEAVDIGLVDREAVIPDAGEPSTVGADDETLLIPDEDEPTNSAARLVIIASAAPTARAVSKLPSSTGPGEPHRKDEAVAYSDLKAGLAKRLGVTDADASDETLLSALDETLEEQADTTATAPAGAPTDALPKGAVVVDEATLADLRRDAALGAQARAEQDQTRRERIVDAAVADGRITAASRDLWIENLSESEQRATAILEGMPKNKIPVEEIGNAGDPVDTAEASTYSSVYPTAEKAGA
ncbi:head maturation protease, ClpP-related [Microbacterium trichothecenolyticum]|uniref:head maturation protease, ClpP-related n=1 Tax=Microbacterium trichothecenolyticum TaxID=69370 RepID=UPI0035BE697D